MTRSCHKTKSHIWPAPEGSFLKLLGANWRVGAGKAKSNTGIGANFSRRRKNPFKKLPSAYFHVGRDLTRWQKEVFIFVQTYDF
jgi:hypothetical protein